MSGSPGLVLDVLQVMGSNTSEYWMDTFSHGFVAKIVQKIV